MTRFLKGALAALAGALALLAALALIFSPSELPDRDY